jgi:hypothetical protein
VASADGAPTRQSYDVFRELSARIDQQLIQLQQVMAQDVAAFNELIHTSGIPAVIP